MEQVRKIGLLCACLGLQLGTGSVVSPAESATCIGEYSSSFPTIVDNVSGLDNISPGSISSNIACGSGAIAAGADNKNTAIGNETFAGNQGNQTGSDNTALGSAAKAGTDTTTDNNIAIGTNSRADGGNAIAIGAGATATRANQIVVGISSNSYTLPGLASSGSFIGTTNQDTSREIQFVTVDSGGNLGTNNFSPTAINNSINSINDDISSLNSSVAATNGRLTNAETRLTNAETRLDQTENSLKTINSQIENVGALAAALSAIPNLTSDNKTYGCGIGTGGYGSGWAGAAGCAGKIGSNVWLNGAVAFTGANSTPWGSTSSVAGRIGLFLQW